jgi:hypothetical protein
MRRTSNLVRYFRTGCLAQGLGESLLQPDDGRGRLAVVVECVEEGLDGPARLVDVCALCEGGGRVLRVHAGGGGREDVHGMVRAGESAAGGWGMSFPRAVLTLSRLRATPSSAPLFWPPSLLRQGCSHCSGPSCPFI